MSNNIDRCCKQNKIDCVYLLISASDDPSIRIAESKGYHLTDIRITLAYYFNKIEN